MSSLKDKIVIIFGVVIVGLAFGMGMLWTKVANLEKGTKDVTAAPAQQQAAQPTAAPVSMESIKGLFGKDVIKMGKGDKKLVFVEVSDPSCPYCHIAGGKNPELNAQVGDRFKMVADGGTYLAPVPEMKKLVEQGKADFVWLYSPGHGNGEMGTKAMYCANEKGKFWQVNDLLLTSKGYEMLNNTVKNDKAQAGTLADFLSSAVDKTFLKGCLEGGKYDTRLQADAALSSSLGVQGTPGFFVNGTRFAGAYSFTDMKTAVDSALK